MLPLVIPRPSKHLTWHVEMINGLHVVGMYTSALGHTFHQLLHDVGRLGEVERDVAGILGSQKGPQGEESQWIFLA